MARPDELQVVLAAAEADGAELAALTAQLRQELLGLDVHRVEPVPAGEPPPGARAGDVVAIGALLVSLAGQANLLQAVVDTVKGWLGRVGQPGTVKLEIDGDVIELTGASSRQQQQVIDVWLARHAAAGTSPPGGSAGT